MSRAPSTFREVDLKRALRGIKNAGETAEAVEIKGDCIKIKIKNGKEAVITTDTDTDDTNTNPWDEVDLK